MISSIISRVVILVFGTLYPAYASYKAVRTKNLKEYVKWMMYWIVFALFTCVETFTDVFLSWFPFYYEVKIILVLWLLSPATKGSSILYRNFVHPALSRREQEIDDIISKAKEQGYHAVLNLGSIGVNYASSVILQTAIRNLNLATQPGEREPERGGNRRAIADPDVIEWSAPVISEDSYQYDVRDSDDLPKIVEVVSESGECDLDDADFTLASSSARSRGKNVMRKKKGAKEARGAGRKTRSQSALEHADNLILLVD